MSPVLADSRKRALARGLVAAMQSMIEEKKKGTFMHDVEWPYEILDKQQAHQSIEMKVLPANALRL